MKILFICSILLTISFAKINVAGKVISANGEVPILAHAHIAAFGESVYSPLESKEVDKNGNFTFQLKENQYYTLFITAANHIGYQIPIISDNKNLQVNLSIKLEAINYPESFDGIRIVGDWNKFSFRSADDMIKQDNGLYVFEVKSEEEKVGYQVLDVDLNGHSVNGTDNDELEYDGGGDYKSFVKVKNGLAKIVFDPSKVMRPKDNTSSISFSGNNTLSTIANMHHTYNMHQNQWRKERSAYNEKNKSLDGFEYNFESIVKYLDNKINDKDDLIKRYAASCYVSIISNGYKNDATGKKVTQILKISDPLWADNSFSLLDIYQSVYGKEKTNKMIANSFDDIPSNKVKATILALQGLDAKKQGDISKVKGIHKELTKNYSDQKSLSWYFAQLDPSKAVFIGKQVPEFEVKLLHSEETVSRESMLGKYYLIDFWAVWCGPCRAEMPNMHAVYEEFHDKNFEILSLSFDPKIEHVDKYRKDKWDMPWLHTFVESGFKNELSKRFEVSGIPKPVLVDPKGVIIATDLDLRGENLKETLNKFLNTAL